MSVYRPYYDATTFQSPSSPSDAGIRGPSFDYLDDVNQAWLLTVGTASARFYARMALSQPFEVAKFLLQIGSAGPSYVQKTLEDSESEDDDVSYFVDTSKPAELPKSKVRYSKDKKSVLMPTSTALQLLPKEHNLYPEAVAPRYPYIFDTMTAVVDRDGPVGLWRGMHTSCIYEAAAELLQTWFSGFLAASAGLEPVSTDPLQSTDPSIWLAVGVAACTITHVVLSPVAMIRARLLCTTFTTQPRSLRASLLSIRGLAPASVVIPTALAHSVAYLARSATPFLVFALTGADAFHAPVLFYLGQLASRMLELVVRMPLDTVAHRAQVAAQDLDPRSLIVFPTPYRGVFATVWAVITAREPLSSLYRGWRTELVGTVGEWGYKALEDNRPAKEHF